MKSVKCKATNRKGEPCQAWSGESGYCFMHDPGRRAQRQAACSKGGKLASKLRGLPPANVGAVADLLPLLASLIDDVLVNVREHDKRARTIVSLAKAYAEIAQASDIELRIMALEAKANATPPGAAMGNQQGIQERRQHGILEGEMSRGGRQ